MSNSRTEPEPQRDRLGASEKTARRKPAAAYVRMSTEHQKYSPENQAAKIRIYADMHEFDIVKTYSDGGKSGLVVTGRDELQRLISDVASGQAEYETILVYDVSRLGRYQDPDEAAYIEHGFKRAGIGVEYCAEQFANDGSPQSTLIKSVKRLMAAEYSRELSAKVFAGQCRLVTLGYRQGGVAGYGLRRMRIDQSGSPLGILGVGEYKSLQTDRVILVPGPPEEVATVQWMYGEFVEKGKRESEIANDLNARGLRAATNRKWTRGAIHGVLTNEKYIGNNVYNRRSFKLKQERVENDPESWVRADGAFEPIVESDLFYRAREIIAARRRRYTDEEMLDRLKRLHDRHGYLSGFIIDEAEDTPSSGMYQRRFGSLVRAYELVGFTPDRDFSYIRINRALRRLHREVVSDTVSTVEGLGACVNQDKDTGLLDVNGEFTASIVIARFRWTASRSRRWKIRLDRGLAPDITIAVRMDERNEQPIDYYLLPLADMSTGRILLTEQNGFMLDAFRFDSLEYFFAMTERRTFREAAA